MPDRFYNQAGDSVNAVYGYTHFLLDLLLEARPVYIATAFDESLNTCFRNRLYPDYKANRAPPDENLAYQLAQCREVTGLLGICHLADSEYEADDIIGSLKKKLGRGRQSIIVTRDKDLGQLVGEQDLLWDYAANEFLTAEAIKDKLGVHPHQIPDFLALAGDAVDNIPGLRGVGNKTAVALLGHSLTVSQLLANPEKVLSTAIKGSERVYASLKVQGDLLRTYRQITTIHCDVPLTIRLRDLRPARPDSDRVAHYFDQMGFGKSIREKFNTLSEIK